MTRKLGPRVVDLQGAALRPDRLESTAHGGSKAGPPALRRNRPSAYRGRRRPVCRNGRSGSCRRVRRHRNRPPCVDIRRDSGRGRGSSTDRPPLRRPQQAHRTGGKADRHRQGKRVVAVDLYGWSRVAGTIEHRHTHRCGRHHAKACAARQAVEQQRGAVAEGVRAAPAFKQADMSSGAPSGRRGRPRRAHHSGGRGSRSPRRLVADSVDSTW